MVVASKVWASVPSAETRHSLRTIVLSLYSELYHRVYRQMNERLRPLSAEIRDIIDSAPAARGGGGGRS